MTAKTLDFRRKGDQQENCMIHLSELIAFRYSLNLSGVFLEKKKIQFKGTARHVSIFPSLDEADLAVISTLLSKREIAVLSEENDTIIEGIHRAVPGNVVNEKDMRPNISFEEESKIWDFQSKISHSINVARRKKLKEAVDKQCPIIGQLDVSIIRSRFKKLDSIDMGNANSNEIQFQVDAVRDEALKLLNETIDDLRNRHLGSNWVEIKHDPNLLFALRQSIREVIERSGVKVEQPSQKADVILLFGKPK